MDVCLFRIIPRTMHLIPADMFADQINIHIRAFQFFHFLKPLFSQSSLRKVFRDAVFHKLDPNFYIGSL